MQIKCCQKHLKVGQSPINRQIWSHCTHPQFKGYGLAVRKFGSHWQQQIFFVRVGCTLFIEPNPKLFLFNNHNFPVLRAVDYARPRNWRKDLWELDPEDPENNGLQESILQNFVVTTDGSFLKNSHPFFHLFQTNITIFIAIIYEKIQYTVLGFEPTTFRLRVSSHNHETMAFRLQLMASCLSYDSFRVGF